VISTREQFEAAVPAPERADESRFRRWARRRARQLLWVAAVLAVSMVVVAAGVMLSRAVRLIGLPDIGDPFDVAAFRALNTLPAAQDADVLIRQAAAKASKRPEAVAVRLIGTTGGWSKIDPKLRQWLEANREALALFRRGVERPDGIVSRKAEKSEGSGDLDFGPLVVLAMLEGYRLEDQGDMEGAWSWYRTVLRMRLLAMQRGSVPQRLLVDRQCAILRKRIDSWAANPKTRVSLVRRALDVVLACEPKPEWDAHSLRIEYLGMMNQLSRPDGWVQHGTGPERDYRIANVKLPDELTSRLYAARRLVRNEPEVSRRVLRLAFANWLAHDRDPDPHRRNPSAVASFEFLNWNVAVPFFTAGPKAPDGARKISPNDLARWLLTARDAKWLLDNWPWWTVRLSEKRSHASLVMLLAEELFERDHGKPPPRDEDLVGPYLDHLPDDGSDEIADARTRWVRQTTGLELSPEDNRQ
jgi:hypothetical protein